MCAHGSSEEAGGHGAPATRIHEPSLRSEFR